VKIVEITYRYGGADAAARERPASADAAVSRAHPDRGEHDDELQDDRNRHVERR